MLDSTLPVPTPDGDKKLFSHFFVGLKRFNEELKRFHKTFRDTILISTQLFKIHPRERLSEIAPFKISFDFETIQISS